MTGAYYNEFKPEAVHMLRQLIKDGLIAPGEVDERSITEVKADDIRNYTQCHFFAGIGGWSVALRQAGWDDDRPVWTGSCPCQGYSPAGKQEGASDPRNLWPDWYRLIRECKPTAIFGEQVAASIAVGWVDEVAYGLEAENYSFAAAVLPACSVGRPHRRDRLWFVGYLSSAGFSNGRCGKIRKSTTQQEFERSSTLGNTQYDGRNGRPISGGNGGNVSGRSEGKISTLESSGASEPSNVAYPECGRRSRPGALGKSSSAKTGFAGEADKSIDDCTGERIEWIQCPDGKIRPIEPSIRLLAHGVQHRTPILHAFGNAIVPEVAATFIRSAKECMQ